MKMKAVIAHVDMDAQAISAAAPLLLLLHSRGISIPS